MHIEISAGGLRGGVAVASFQNGMKSYISGTKGMISSFKAVRAKTYNLNGGIGRLSEAVGQVNLRIGKEQNRKSGAETVQRRTNVFLDLAIRVDNGVASLVKQNQEELYGKYPSLRSSIGQWMKGWLSDACNRLSNTGNAFTNAVNKVWNVVTDTSEKIRRSIVSFYDEFQKKMKFYANMIKLIIPVTVDFVFPLLPKEIEPGIFRLLRKIKINSLRDVPTLKEYVEDDSNFYDYVTKNDYIFGEDNSYEFATTRKSMMFHEGPSMQPKWQVQKNKNDTEGQYDNYYPYDPNAEWTLKNYLDWKKWEDLAPIGAKYFKDVPDGMATYLHYRSGTGTPVWIDYEKAYHEDSTIANDINFWVANTNDAVRKMISQGATLPFSITSEFLSMSYPVTENWQKAIGDHRIWISADISEAGDGSIIVTTTAHEIDRYNFNEGQRSIGDLIPDEWNGRFETFGWAKSFDTHGEITFETNLSIETDSPHIVNR